MIRNQRDDHRNNRDHRTDDNKFDAIFFEDCTNSAAHLHADGDKEQHQKECKEQIADNDSKLTNYLSTTRLTPFARWSSYWQSNNKISNNADVGVRFTIPIWNETPRKRQALETQKEIIRSSRGTDVKEIKQSVGILLKKIDNLNKAIATEAFHIDQTGKYIEMRRFAYQNQKQGYNYLMRMDEYTGLLESMERMYKLMQNRALAIINIEKAVSIYDNNNIFKEIEL